MHITAAITAGLLFAIGGQRISTERILRSVFSWGVNRVTGRCDWDGRNANDSNKKK